MKSNKKNHPFNQCLKYTGMIIAAAGVLVSNVNAQQVYNATLNSGSISMNNAAGWDNSVAWAISNTNTMTITNSGLSTLTGNALNQVTTANFLGSGTINLDGFGAQKGLWLKAYAPADASTVNVASGVTLNIGSNASFTTAGSTILTGGGVISATSAFTGAQYGLNFAANQSLTLDNITFNVSGLRYGTGAAALIMKNNAAINLAGGNINAVSISDTTTTSIGGSGTLSITSTSAGGAAITVKSQVKDNVALVLDASNNHAILVTNTTNAYSGGTVIKQGFLNLTSANVGALGSGAVTITGTGAGGTSKIYMTANSGTLKNNLIIQGTLSQLQILDGNTLAGNIVAQSGSTWIQTGGNSNGTITFSGAISGNIVKFDNSAIGANIKTFTLTGANSYTDTILANSSGNTGGAIIKLQNQGSVGTGKIDLGSLTANKLIANRTDNYVMASGNNIIGSGTFQVASGTVTYSANASNTGGTEVLANAGLTVTSSGSVNTVTSAGNLAVAGKVGTANVNGGTLLLDNGSVGNLSLTSGVLAGAGAVSTVASIGSGATINPGNGGSFGTLTLNGGAINAGTIVMDFGANGNDSIVLGNGVSLSGATLDLNFNGNQWSGDGLHTVSLFTGYTDGLTGLSLGTINWNSFFDNNTYQLVAGSNTFNNGVLSFTLEAQAVPEPSTYVLIGVGIGLVCMMRMMRRKSV